MSGPFRKPLRVPTCEGRGDGHVCVEPGRRVADERHGEGGRQHQLRPRRQHDPLLVRHPQEPLLNGRLKVGRQSHSLDITQFRSVSLSLIFLRLGDILCVTLSKG